MAVSVVVKGASSSMGGILGTPPKTGAEFTSLTTTFRLFVSLAPKLSVTVTPTMYVPGPCASVGVQVR